MESDKRKRQYFTVEQKEEIIRQIDNKELKVEVAKKYGIKPSTVSTIYKNRERILEEWNRGCTTRKHFKDANALTWTELGPDEAINCCAACISLECRSVKPFALAIVRTRIPDDR